MESLKLQKNILRKYMKIFLVDLVHTWPSGGIWTIPLNVGYVGSYLKKIRRRWY